MIKRTLRYLWGRKFLFLGLALVILLLPDTINRDLQVRTTTVITAMTIDNTTTELEITAQKFPDATTTFQGTDIQAMLADVSLAHCTNIDFVGEVDCSLLKQLYNYQDLRANTTVNHQDTIDDWLKNQHYCYQ